MDVVALALAYANHACQLLQGASRLTRGIGGGDGALPSAHLRIWVWVKGLESTMEVVCE